MIALAWLALALAQEPDAAPPGDLPPMRVEPSPRVGVESIVTLVDDLDRAEPGATVQVVYRPGLSGERQRAVGITDSRGRVRWTPEVGGVATVRAGDVSLPLTVAWEGPPAATVTLLALLGVASTALLGYGALPRRTPRRRESP